MMMIFIKNEANLKFISIENSFYKKNIGRVIHGTFIAMHHH